MKKLFLAVLCFVCASILHANSYVWPPPDYVLAEPWEPYLFRFESQFKDEKRKEITGTRLIYFEYDRKAVAYVCKIDKVVPGEFRPVAAHPTYDKNLFIFLFNDPDVSLVLLDTRDAKILVQRSLIELFPETKNFDYRWKRSWISTAKISGDRLNLLIIRAGVSEDGEAGEKVPAKPFSFDLKTYEMRPR